MDSTSSAPRKVALIAGASGLVGGQLLTLLLNSGRYAKVISVGRRPLPLMHPRLEQRTVDFDRLEDYRLSLIADDVFCCLGTTMRRAGSREAFYQVDYLYVVKLAALTAANFAAQFMVVSALGADTASSFYYNRVKGDMEAAVRQAPFRAIHIFRPSLLLGERAEKRLGEQVGAVLLRLLGPLMVGPLRAYRGVPAPAVAQAMLNAAYQEGGGVRVYLSDEIAKGVSPSI
jgi:uncharacterized protein YbjT (DUF2867 family)